MSRPEDTKTNSAIIAEWNKGLSSAAELAEMFGKSANSIKAVLSRARKKGAVEVLSVDNSETGRRVQRSIRRRKGDTPRRLSGNMKDSTTKQPTTFSLSPALKKLVEAEAALRDRSRSWITSEAIHEYLERRKKIDPRVD